MDTDYAGVVLALCPTLFGSSDGYAAAVELVGGIDALRYVECDQLVSVQPGHLAVTDISDIKRLERITSRFAVLHVQYLRTFCREYASGLGRGLFRFPTVPGYYYSRHLAGHDLYLTGYGCVRRSAGRQRERTSLAAKAAAMGARLYTQGSPAALLARLHRVGVEEAKSQRSATQGPSALTPSAVEEPAGGLLIIVPSSMHLLRFLRACDVRGADSAGRVRGVPDELPRLFAEHCVSASFVHDLFAAASQQDARAVLRAQRGNAYALRLFEGVAFHTNGCALLQESGERADRCAAGADAGETSQILQLIERHDSLAALPSPAAAPLLDGLLSQRIGPSQGPDHGLPRALAALGISACSERATSMLFFDTDGDAPMGPGVGVGVGIGAGMDADGGAGGVSGAGGYSPSTAFYVHAGMRTPRLLRLYDGRRRAYAPVFTYTQPLLGYYTRLVDTLARPPAPASPDSGSRISGAGAPARACLFAALYASPHFASLARLLRPKPIILALYGEDDPDALLRDARSALYAALNLPPAVVQEYARLWAPAAAGLEPPGPPEPAPKAPDAQGPQGSEHDLLLAALRLLMDNVCVVPYTLAVSEDFVAAFRDRAFVVADLQLVYNVEAEVSTLLAAAGAGADGGGGAAGSPNQSPGTAGLTTLRRAASRGAQGLVLQAFRRRRAAALPQARRLFAELQAFMTQSAARVQGCLWLQVLFEQALHSVLDTRARPGVIAQTALTPFLLQDASRQAGSADAGAGAGGGLACCAWLGAFADSAWKVCMHKGVSDEEFSDPLRAHSAGPGSYLLMSAECVAGALCRAPPPPHGAPPQLRQMAAILRRPGSLARLLRSLFKGLGVAALGLERAFAAVGLGVPGPLPYPPLDEACAALAELCGHGEGGAATPTAPPVWYPALSGAAAPAPPPEGAHPDGGGGSGGSAAHAAHAAAVLMAHGDRAVDIGVFLERALGSCGNYTQSLEAAGCAALQGLSQAAGLPEFVDIGLQLLSERDAPQSTRYSLNSVQHSAMQDYLSTNTEHTHDSSATDERFRLRRVN